MALQQIKLGGESRPVRFNRRALASLEQEWEVKGLQQLGEKVQNVGMSELPSLAYVGLLEGARKMKQEFTASKDDVRDWLDDEPISIFAVFMEAFAADVTQDVEGEKKTEAKGEK